MCAENKNNRQILEKSDFYGRRYQRLLPLKDKVIGIKDGRAENRKNALTHFNVIVSAQPATDYPPGTNQTND